MRKSLVLATLLVLACSAAAFAGVPDVTRSGVALNSPPAGCQFRFNAAGGIDQMTLSVTLRDAFDVPVVNCSTSATLGAASIIAADCNGLVQTASSDSGGVITFTYACLGGRGTASLFVTAHCSGDISMGPGTVFTFTSPDLNASMEGTNSTTVGDLGVWAAGLTGFVLASDWNCSGGIATIVDLAGWATGLGKGCNDCP